MKIDLHLHSSYSMLGEYSVLELFKKVEEAGIEFAAIADEDSIQSIAEVTQYQSFSPVKWISAAQLSVEHQGRYFQIIAYGIMEHPWFRQHEKNVKDSYEHRFIEIIRLLNEYYHFDLSMIEFKEYANEKCLSVELLASYILSLSRLDENAEMKKFKLKASRFYKLETNFMNQYLVAGKKTFVHKYASSYYEAIQAIHLVGGVAVLANPGLSIQEDHAFLNELVHLGLDGIECYSPYHSEIQNAFYVAFALKRQLLITCGSDFGRLGEKIKAGQTHCPMNKDEIIGLFRKRGLSI